MEENAKKTEKEETLKLQTYVAADDKKKYLFLKELLTKGADIPDSQALKLIINRLHAMETDKKKEDISYLVTYTRHIERRLRATENELKSLRESIGSKVEESRQRDKSLRLEDNED